MDTRIGYKKLLIIGNGFDLAHELPTSYSDFLEFTKRFMAITTFNENYDKYSVLHINHWNGNEYLKESLRNLFDNKIEWKDTPDKRSFRFIAEEMNRLSEDIYNNVWYDYLIWLFDNHKARGTNWIDFEAEIANIVNFIDVIIDNSDSLYLDLQDAMINGEYRNEKTINFGLFSALISNRTISKEEYINELYVHLERLTDALNIYLSAFVEKIKVKPIRAIEDINPDMVISFNYTHTFHATYDKNVPVCYIHGECRCSDRSNIVLGVNEYLDSSEKDERTDMAIFKKFVQRIRKKNDISYREWLAQSEEFFNRHRNNILRQAGTMTKDVLKVYVYGHSLDITDKDLLEKILKPDYSSICLYAHNYQDEGKLISNIIKIIGEDTLIDKSTNYPIMFKTVVNEE